MWKRSRDVMPVGDDLENSSRFIRGGGELVRNRGSTIAGEEEYSDTARGLLNSRGERDLGVRGGDRKYMKSVATSHSSFVSVYDLTDTRRAFRSNTRKSVKRKYSVDWGGVKS